MVWTWAHPIIIGIAIPIALFFFGKAILFKYRLLKTASKTPDKIDEYPRRVSEFFTVFLGQRKLFQDFRPGLMHAVIFWGFCVLLLRALTLFGMAFGGFGFHLPILYPAAFPGNLYSFVKDLANVFVLAMVVYAMLRRYVFRVPRLLNTPGALFVLLMIMGLMISDLVFDGVMHAAENTGFQWYAPAGSLLGTHIFSAVPALPRAILGQIGYFFHTLGILVFLVYLPAGKHMHIITSVFNVVLKPFNRSGRLTKLDLEDETIESYGAVQIEDYTWKDFLDMYTCTECGRCNDVCPARRTQKKLAPREITIHQKHLLLDREAVRLLSGDGKQASPQPLVPEIVSPEEIWACTTCQSCEQACPVSISYVQRINSMRRSEVLMKGQFPAELKRIFKGLETNSNPWGIGASTRMDWAKDLDLPLIAENPGAEYLLYFGCAASFDDRAQKISRSLVEYLRSRQVSFAVLGADEPCCGETARRLGEEALGQTLMTANIELFKELRIKKILTLCPHCFNTFRNEYPDFGGSFEVIHHSQLVARDILSGKNDPLRRPGSVVIHDSCYLGRINGIYDPSRSIMGGIDKKILEPVETREKGFCCGGGGGLFWMEESGERINHERFRQLASTGAEVIATSCPYCLNMLEDACKTLDHPPIQVKDIIEIYMEH